MTIELELVLPRLPHLDRRSSCDLEVIVPAYNEEHRLPATLASLGDQLGKIAGIHSRIVVVDNGSCDRTAEMVDHYRASAPHIEVSLIGCAIRGKGAAVRRGALTSQALYLGFFDADSATPATALVQALDRLRGGADVVIASRRCEGARYAVRQPISRRIASWAFNLAVADLVPGVRDTQCGFKFFTRAAALGIFANFHTPGFTFDVELLVRAHRLQLEITEIPVVWTHDAASSLNTLAEAPRILAELMQLRRVCQQIA